jgi:Tfp pilus assembly protein PilN
MSMFPQRTPAGGGAPSFLPEDYLQKKQERRSIVIALMLFLVVGFFMVAAFFVTYRQWSGVKLSQEEVNRDYAEQTKKIEQLKVLEAQRDELKEKAEVTTALIERVPRSILMAELINRMPKQLTLTEATIKSKRVAAAPPQPAGAGKPGTLSGGVGDRASKAPAPAPKPGQAPANKPKPSPPKFDFTIELSGLSATDEDIADYMQSLVQCPLLDKVEMIGTEDTTVEQVAMRKFRVEAKIRPTADARTIEPLHVPRMNPRPGDTARRKVRDPMDPTQERPDDPNFDATKARTNAE